jgi:hypothetical protein
MSINDRGRVGTSLADVWPTEHPRKLNHLRSEIDEKPHTAPSAGTVPLQPATQVQVLSTDVSEPARRAGLIAYEVIPASPKQNEVLPSGYRLAWQVCERQLGVCGPSFASLAQAQAAAPDYNTTRQTRGQVSCTHVVHLHRTTRYGGNGKKVLAVFLADGAALPLKGKWVGSVIVLF